MKNVFYGFVFLFLCCAMFVSKGCDWLMSVSLDGPDKPVATAVVAVPVAAPEPAPVQTAKPVAKPRKPRRAKPSGHPYVDNQTDHSDLVRPMLPYAL